MTKSPDRFPSPIVHLPFHSTKYLVVFLQQSFQHRQVSSFSFDILNRDSGTAARTGRLTTPHGTIETPNFIFCATKASIKGVAMEQVKEAGADIILSNTYHLLLQPGPEIVAKCGGLHKMTQWDGPMLTDSGGFQIFSIGHG